MIKKKIFFILSSLRAGGAERVYWLICQHFNPQNYEVCLVVLHTKDRFFSIKLENVRVINLATAKASASFFSLYSLIKKEKPYAIFSAGGQIDLVLSLLSHIIKVPFLIARSTSIPGERIKYANSKAKLVGSISKMMSPYSRFNSIICQTEEMKTAWLANRKGLNGKLIVIPNPVSYCGIKSTHCMNKDKVKLIIVATLSLVKGINRLIEIVSLLPENFFLTIAGSGKEAAVIQDDINTRGLQERIQMVGQVKDVLELMAEHDIFVLTSFVEGFPNVALEALSVGLPVVSFQVSGISELIIDDFNGYMVNQGDLIGFKNRLVEASLKNWDRDRIREHVQRRYAIEPIVKMYEGLI
jgi:glycosyltransferase involved in cell wall biosynthesis